jgi:TIR domain/Inner membrane component of T3SS, cytoplasmic domain
MWDVFISYASEDRAVAKSLAEALTARGLEVWFDQFALSLGDSLRRSIDLGLSQSRFGVVLISRDYLRKDWTQRELSGLFSLEVQGRKVLLPVWHGVSVDEVASHSPLLLDRLAVSTAEGIVIAAERISATVRSAGEESKPRSDRNMSPRTPGDYVLRVTAGRDVGAVFRLGHERVIVGRSTTADVRLSEPMASRSHFAIVWDVVRSSYFVEDWGHSNRILLNGVVVDPRTRSLLRLGDELRLGETVLRYEPAQAGA